MRVKEVMSAPAKVLVAEIPVHVALAYMNWHKLHRMPVVKKGILVGIVTQSELVRATLRNGRNGRVSEKTVREVMTWHPQVVRPDDEVEGAARKMAARKLHALPVVVSGKVIGMITQSDLVRKANVRGNEEGPTPGGNRPSSEGGTLDWKNPYRIQRRFMRKAF